MATSKVLSDLVEGFEKITATVKRFAAAAEKADAGDDAQREVAFQEFANIGEHFNRLEPTFRGLEVWDRPRMRKYADETSDAQTR